MNINKKFTALKAFFGLEEGSNESVELTEEKQKELNLKLTKLAALEEDHSTLKQRHEESKSVIKEQAEIITDMQEKLSVSNAQKKKGNHAVGRVGGKLYAVTVRSAKIDGKSMTAQEIVSNESVMKTLIEGKSGFIREA